MCITFFNLLNNYKKCLIQKKKKKFKKEKKVLSKLLEGIGKYWKLLEVIGTRKHYLLNTILP